MPRLQPMILTPRIEEAFWKKVERSINRDECWPWTGEINRDGVGIFRGYPAHRWSWMINTGALPPDITLDDGTVHHPLILHGSQCTMKHCVNVYHLYVADLVTDAHIHPERYNTNTNLNADIVRACRRTYSKRKATMQQLAKRIGVSTQAMRLLLCGATWGWVEGAVKLRTDEEEAIEAAREMWVKVKKRKT